MFINILTAMMIISILLAVGCAFIFWCSFEEKNSKWLSKKDRVISLLGICIAIMGFIFTFRVDNRIYFIEKDIKSYEKDLKQLNEVCTDREFISKSSSNNDYVCEMQRRDIKYKIKKANEKRDWYLIQKFSK